MFRGILIEKDDSGTQHRSVAELDEAQLPDGDVTVRVSHSTVNYKDALAITGRGAVARSFPLVPGIDFAGVVEASSDGDHHVGDRVIGNGFGIGEKTWGGLAQLARVKAEGLVPMPSELSARNAMAIGTGGFTAMLAIQALERHGLTPQSGPLLVTGASGGVGSFAVSLLAKLGYHVIASTGRLEEGAYLTRLGASRVIDRSELSAPGRPLAKERWAGAIDSVGSHTLANVCASTLHGGAVAACGLAQGMDFPATVAPFILRGISLLGIDSALRPRAERLLTWQRLVTLADESWFSQVARDISLDEVIPLSYELLAGKVRGRVVVDIGAEPARAS